MASITTILGTHSLSSSRLTINNNFDNVNDELGLIANVLDTTSSTLSLTGAITAGTLSLNTGSLTTFNVTASSLEASVEATFKENVLLEKSLQVSIADTVTLPTGTPALGSYIFTGTAGSTVTLGASAPGQLLTLIASNAFDIDGAMVNGVPTDIQIAQNGSVSLIGDLSQKWYIAAVYNAVIS
tara:strand:- start:18278 stop:18829 length:552 start_codon:yes stop_codon:yes gene_type:complete